MKFFRFFFAITLFISSHFLSAQPSPEWNSSQILSQLHQLNTVGSVLYIAAHPDDENTRLIAYLTKGLHLRTGYLSITRGDGGQNLIGNEQGEALGLIRTQELLAARRIDGAEQFFTRANDFGFSKNPTETLKLWDKEKVLSDMVWTIRRFKPDVIICRFPTTGEGGHGHHTASAILALEAFDAAADATKFSEQLTETTTWQAKRILWNTFNFGGNNTTAPDQLKLDVGKYNPLLGNSYGEIASKSRTMHKSQGFGTALQRGENVEYFKFLKGDLTPKISPFDELNFTWSRFPVMTDLTQKINNVITKFNPEHPENSIKELKTIYEYLSFIKVPDQTLLHWVQYQKTKLEEIILQCAGVWAEAYTSDFSATPSDTIKVTAQIIARSSAKVKLEKITVSNNTTAINKYLPANQMESITTNSVIEANHDYTNPYWLQEPHTNTMYTVNSQNLIDKPENTPALSAVYTIDINGLTMQITRPISYKWTDPVKGELYRPFEILPPVVLSTTTDLMIFTSNLPQRFDITVKANKDDISGKLILTAPSGWKITLENPQLSLNKKGDEIRLYGFIQKDENAQDGELKIAFQVGEKLYHQTITRIEYDHIPYQFFLSDTQIKLTSFSLNKGATSIGYIPGAGDKVAECLALAGYQVTILTNELLEKDDLTKYTAIIAGVRAFNVNKDLKTFHDKFMNYMQQGGNFIVQYNTNNRLAPLTEQIGPFPFTITTTRVTDENAPVKILQPKHRVVTQPNIITQQDFDHWVQERGIYFASEIDARYERIFEMNDPNEKASDGSLIIGTHGKGHFVYTGLAFFRELPAGVAGAYRLLANLINLNSIEKQQPK